MAGRSKGGKGGGRPRTLGYANKGRSARPASPGQPLEPYRMRKGRKSTPPLPPLSEANQYDVEGNSLWCPQCKQIFNGPGRGETVTTHAEKRRAEERARAANPMQGGLNSALCNKKSCIDSYIEEILITPLQNRHPDRDFSEARQRAREREYQERRLDTERYPGGLIDDTEADT